MGSQKKKEPVEKTPLEQSTADKLAELDSQRRALLDKVKQEKRAAVEARKAAKRQRNDVLAHEKETVHQIQEEIYAYNKLNKQKRADCKIIEKIRDLLNGVDASFRNS